MGTASRQVTESVRRRPPAQCRSEDHGLNAVLVKRVHWRENANSLGSVREVANPKGTAANRVCNRVEVPTAIAARWSRCPKGDLWTCFPEQSSGRAKLERPTGGSNRTQKARCTTACCWAMETSTTEVKVMKGLTRPCADLAGPKTLRGSSPGQTELALKLALFKTRPVRLLVRLSAFQAEEVGFESHTGH